jgi:hypothetical protein
LENSPGEEHKTLRIVEIVPFGGAVKIFPVEKLIPADEIDGNILIQAALIDLCPKGLLPERDLYAFPQILERKPGLFDHPVIGHH